MAGWTVRAFARPRIAVLGIVAILAGALVPVTLSPQADAVEATGGKARFPQAQWISWGPNGADLIPDASGDITRTETMHVGGQQIFVTCTIDDLTQQRVTNMTPPLIRAYSSGQWQGDGFDDLYNIGGTGTNNTLSVGIRSVKDGAHITFDFACTAEMEVGASRVPVQLAGLVLANAESSGTGTGPFGNTWEYIGATIPAEGTWRIIDRIRGDQCTNDNYARLTGNAGQPKTLRIYGAKNNNCEGNNSAQQPNPTTVAYMEGVSSATDVTLYGNGFEGVALGVVINTEFGDAPSTYGVAGAVSQGGFSGGVPPTYGGSGDGQSVWGMQLANSASPALRLGSTIDFETEHQASANANGDDNDGNDDEDGVTLASSYSATPGATITIPNVQCNATAAQPGCVAGWIDFNADGEFQNSERSNAVACSVGRKFGEAASEHGQPSLPPDAVAGNSTVSPGP